MLSANMRYRVAILQKRAVIEEIDKNVQYVTTQVVEKCIFWSIDEKFILLISSNE